MAPSCVPFVVRSIEPRSFGFCVEIGSVVVGNGTGNGLSVGSDFDSKLDFGLNLDFVFDTPDDWNWGDCDVSL